MPQVYVDVAPPQFPGGPARPLAQTDAAKAIELIQAQIGGVKAEINELTAQLTPGASRMREQAIEQQLSSSNERLTQLQQQLDRVVSGNEEYAVMPDMSHEDKIPREVVNIIEMSLIAAVMMTLGLPIVRMIARRFDRRPPTDSPETAGRFDRLEQAVDAVAIEVERISEGQRYSSKMLNEMRGLPAPNPLERWPESRVGVREEVKG
jgi:hypothetical protein